MSQMLNWFGRGNAADNLAKGNCNCTDCNGPSGTAECFWDDHAEVAKNQGTTFVKPGGRLPGPAHAAEQSRPRSASGPVGQPRSRAGSGSAPNLGQFESGQSDVDYFSATGIASDSDGGGGGGGRGDGGRGGLLPTAGVGSPLVGTGRQPNPDTTKGQKKKKKKQRKRTTSNSTEPPVSPIELAAADFDEERAAYEKAIRVQQQQLSSLTRALDNQQAERKAAEKELSECRARCKVLAEKDEKDADPRTIIDPNFMMQYRELQKYVSATKISNQDAVAAGLLRNPFVECSADWHGAGSPYLFYLASGAHVAIPQLVASLTESSLSPRLMLVGACAWNCYTTIPLNSEDIDFVVHGAPDSTELKDAIAQAVVIAAQAPEVRLALDILDAVSKQTRRWSGSSFGGDSVTQSHQVEIASIVQSVKDSAARASERQSGAQADDFGVQFREPADDARYQQYFRIVPNQHGWRVLLAHRALLDLCPAEASVGPMQVGMNAVMSNVLPSTIHWRYDSAVNPVMQVAHPLLMLDYLRISLASGDHWRIQKDLPRLRLLAQDAWLQHNASVPEGPPYMFGSPELLEGFETLLDEHDRMGIAMHRILFEQRAQLSQLSVLVPGGAKPVVASGFLPSEAAQKTSKKKKKKFAKSLTRASKA